MICVNELSALKCSKKEILNQLTVTLAPFAPHVCEELWETLGNTGSVCDAQWPAYNEEYLVENTVNYTISFNGKARSTWNSLPIRHRMSFRKRILADERSMKWTDGKNHRQSNRKYPRRL